ncbi:MAG: hypothetical protein GX877_02075 [Bacteroidales bacterium]|nr:hypothetical protein [Bacteroidales bacterium]
MTRKFTIREWLPAVLLVTGSFLFFFFFYPYHNLFKEQMTLFLHSGDYFFTFIGKPAWLTRYIGEFLTQFYIVPAGGALILTGAFLAAWILFRSYLIRCGLQRSIASWIALLLIIPEFLFHGSLYYPLSSTLSGLMALGAVLAFTGLRPSLYKWLFLPAAPLLYYLTGHGLFLFTFLWLVYGFIRKDGKRYYALLLLLISLSFPLLMRSVFQLTPKQAYTYPLKAPLSARMDFTLEKILAMDYAAQQGNWTRVLFLAQKYQLNNSMAAYYTNLALSQTRLMGDWLFQFHQPGPGGLFLPVSPESTSLAIVFSNEVFFSLGDMNMAQHSAMLGMIFSQDHRSVRLTKRLAEIHLLTEDYPAADKYLGLLDKTLFYRRWPNELPEHITLEHTILREKIPSVEAIRHSADYTTSLEILLQSHPDNAPALDYLLCFHLLNKDIPGFRRTYDTWYPAAKNKVPEVYAQALLVSLYREGASSKIIEQYDIPAATVSRFIEYTKAFEKAGGMSAPLQEEYGKTFWFYYHFILFE